MCIYRLLIEYDGTDFHGWQIQPNQPTVQGALQNALATALRSPVEVVGSGRTDSGVHARGQVAHFASVIELDTIKLARSLNGILPNSVAVLALEEAPEGFHARYDAVRRTYCYYVATAPRSLDYKLRWVLYPAPDFGKMNEAARFLLGTQNFDSFCMAQSETKNRVCSIERADWIEEERPDNWRFEIAADRFLHGMVRAIVGTLVEIGQGKRPVEDIEFVIEAQDRRTAGPAAPAMGLVLERVEYATPIFRRQATAQMTKPVFE